MRKGLYTIRSNRRLSVSGNSESQSSAVDLIGEVLNQEHPQGDPYHKEGGIEVDENRIYFYTEVGENQALELNKILRHLDIEMEYLGKRLGLESTPPIKLHIHSPGGSLFSALSIVDTIKSCKSPVHTFIDGFAASAATLISVVGTKRFATKNSFMLIHQQRMAWEGKLSDFMDEIENQKHVTDTIQSIYLDHSKMKSKELKEILGHELHMPANECKRLGLIDEII